MIVWSAGLVYNDAVAKKEEWGETSDTWLYCAFKRLLAEVNYGKKQTKTLKKEWASWKKGNPLPTSVQDFILQSQQLQNTRPSVPAQVNSASAGSAAGSGVLTTFEKLYELLNSNSAHSRHREGLILQHNQEMQNSSINSFSKLTDINSAARLVRIGETLAKHLVIFYENKSAVLRKIQSKLNDPVVVLDLIWKPLPDDTTLDSVLADVSKAENNDLYFLQICSSIKHLRKAENNEERRSRNALRTRFSSVIRNLSTIQSTVDRVANFETGTKLLHLAQTVRCNKIPVMGKLLSTKFLGLRQTSYLYGGMNVTDVGDDTLNERDVAEDDSNSSMSSSSSSSSLAVGSKRGFTSSSSSSQQLRRRKAITIEKSTIFLDTLDSKDMDSVLCFCGCKAQGILRTICTEFRNASSNLLSTERTRDWANSEVSFLSTNMFFLKYIVNELENVVLKVNELESLKTRLGREPIKRDGWTLHRLDVYLAEHRNAFTRLEHLQVRRQEAAASLLAHSNENVDYVRIEMKKVDSTRVYNETVVTDSTASLQSIAQSSCIYESKGQQVFPGWGNTPLEMVATQNYKCKMKRLEMRHTTLKDNPFKRRSWNCKLHSLEVVRDEFGRGEYDDITTRKLEVMQFNPMFVSDAMNKDLLFEDVAVDAMNVRMVQIDTGTPASNNIPPSTTDHQDRQTVLISPLTHKRHASGNRPCVGGTSGGYLRQTLSTIYNTNRKPGQLADLEDVCTRGYRYRNLLDVLRLDGCLAWHAVNLGSGSGFSVVFSLPKHDFTDAQMVAFDKIMIDYTDHLHQIWTGRIEAPGTVKGKKAVFKYKDEKKCVLHSFQNFGTELGKGYFSSVFGMKSGSDFDLSYDSDEESDESEDDEDDEEESGEEMEEMDEESDENEDDEEESDDEEEEHDDEEEERDDEEEDSDNKEEESDEEMEEMD